MRLAIVTAVWQRPEIFNLFAEGIELLRQQFKNEIEIVVCVAGSEGWTSRTMVDAHKDFYYTESPNHPLGQKMNKATELARKLSADYCLMVGSDDIIGFNLMQRYIQEIRKGTDYVVLMDCYFFDTYTKKGLYWGGYTKSFNKGTPAGIGRLISARALNMIDWVCWPVGFDRILDTGFDKQMQKLPVSKREIWLKNESLFALDVKSSTNMTPFDLWDNSEFVDGHELLNLNLPKEFANKIYQTHGSKPEPQPGNARRSTKRYKPIRDNRR